MTVHSDPGGVTGVTGVTGSKCWVSWDAIRGAGKKLQRRARFWGTSPTLTGLTSTLSDTAIAGWDKIGWKSPKKQSPRQHSWVA